MNDRNAFLLLLFMLIDVILQPFDIFYTSNNENRTPYFLGNELWFVLIIISNAFIHDNSVECICNAFMYNICINGKPNKLLFVHKYRHQSDTQ